MSDTKMNKSRQKALKRSKWFIQKYFHYLQEDNEKAEEFFRKKISTLDSRCTKQFLLEISHEMRFYFMRLLGDSGKWGYTPDNWLAEKLEWYLS